MKTHAHFRELFGPWPHLFLLAVLVLPVVSQAETSLTLKQAQVQATRFSPELQSWSMQRDTDLARGRQAGQRPNPQLEVEAENLAGGGEYSGFGASEWTLSISQEIDISGKRKQARSVWAAQLELTEQEYRTAALDLQQQVGQAFAETWLAQGSLDLAREQLELAFQLRDVVKTRVETGGASQLELTRAQVGIAISEIEVVRAEEEMQRTSLLLASFWGLRKPDFQRVEMDPDFWVQNPTSSLAISPQDNPDITRYTALKNIQSSLIQQARKENAIDLDLGLGIKYDHASGDQAFVLGAGIPLPISNKNQHEVQALASELAQLDKIQAGTSQGIAGELDAALVRQQGAFREMSIMSETVLPLAEQVFEEATRAHVRGLYSQTDVLETRRSLFELYQADLEARYRFLTASIEAARLAGISSIPLTPSGQEAK